ncbi:unnamed protein product [Ceratitis capitata]|uniref:(Mediterranean fruit fly) hypothetical protein n=1 Tax=Ceratitis capitata TaxID=7213 RepID=A0A811UFY9_CERCA|nr:unnamed protein product [Ceratitis capitata]
MARINFVLLFVCAFLVFQNVDSLPQIVVKTTAVASASASVDESGNVRTFANVATATAIDNNVFHITLPQHG